MNFCIVNELGISKPSHSAPGPALGYGDGHCQVSMSPFRRYITKARTDTVLFVPTGVQVCKYVKSPPIVQAFYLHKRNVAS